MGYLKGEGDLQPLYHFAQAWSVNGRERKITGFTISPERMVVFGVVL